MPRENVIQKQVRDLKVGDILAGSGEVVREVISWTGVSGYTKVLLESSNGRQRVGNWRTQTVVGIQTDDSL